MAREQTPVSRVVGEAEKGHLRVERIQRWVKDLYRLHPYVNEVRRVRKDPNISLSPTRILDFANIAQHQKVAPEIPPERIIPAVLDSSHCNPPQTALRINIILPEACGVAEREAAVERRRQDTALFPE